MNIEQMIIWLRAKCKYYMLNENCLDLEIYLSVKGKFGNVKNEDLRINCK